MTIQLTTDEQYFIRQVAARAVEDEAIQAALEAGNLMEVLQAEAHRLMLETIDRQAYVMQLFRGEKWSHEGEHGLMERYVWPELLNA